MHYLFKPHIFLIHWNATYIRNRTLFYKTNEKPIKEDDNENNDDEVFTSMRMQTTFRLISDGPSLPFIDWFRRDASKPLM